VLERDRTRQRTGARPGRGPLAGGERVDDRSHAGRPDAPRARSLRAQRLDDYSYLKTWWLGEGTCLDIVNDGVDTQLHMDACGGYSGQMWRLDAY
jgi:hypothetical protein